MFSRVAIRAIARWGMSQDERSPDRLCSEFEESTLWGTMLRETRNAGTHEHATSAAQSGTLDLDCACARDAGLASSSSHRHRQHHRTTHHWLECAGRHCDTNFFYRHNIADKARVIPERRSSVGLAEPNRSPKPSRNLPGNLQPRWLSICIRRPTLCSTQPGTRSIRSRISPALELPTFTCIILALLLITAGNALSARCNIAL